MQNISKFDRKRSAVEKPILILLFLTFTINIYSQYEDINKYKKTFDEKTRNFRERAIPQYLPRIIVILEPIT